MSVRSRKTIIIGVTGSFGTGKTTVAEIFKTLGAALLDADKLAHGAFKKGMISYRQVVKNFGSGILDKFGKIDRTKLAHLVFRNKRSLSKLCSIVHPIVIATMKESIRKISNSGTAPAIVIDAPLLIEAGLHNIVDYLIVVKTSRQTQIKRAIKKTGLTNKDVISRMKSQLPLAKKIQMADYIVDNEGSKNDTKKVVKKIWEEITPFAEVEFRGR
jgi:dephospho-CoA kinase